MNKQLVFFSIGMMMLASCSQDDTDFIFPQDQTEDNSPVAIRLGWGMPVIDTRASIESDGAGYFYSDSLGVFMLAMHKQDVSTSRVTPTWDPNDAEDSWLDNQRAKIEGSNGVTFLDTDGQDTTFWYPLDNAYAYCFYAYQPYCENITSVAGKRTIHYTALDGTKDIIWGQTTYNSANRYAYSARYFNISANKGTKPAISFSHKMMRLQFQLTGIPDTHADYTECNKMRLDSIWVLNVPTTADLIVADKYGDESGTLNVNWSESQAHLSVRGENDGAFVPQQVNGSNIINVGQPILLPILDDAASFIRGPYQIGLQFSCEETNKIYRFSTIDLDISNFDCASFEAGHTYTVTIKVAGPTEVGENPNVVVQSHE